MPIDYDKLAVTYATNRSAHPVVMARLYAAIAETQQQHADTFLEIGCGTGNYVGSLYAATGVTAWGVDPSAEMLAVARSRWPGVRFEQGAGEALPLGDDAIDLAFSVDVAHHLADPPACFAEAWRVLLPGGRLCTVTGFRAHHRHAGAAGRLLAGNSGRGVAALPSNRYAGGVAGQRRLRAHNGGAGRA